MEDKGTSDGYCCCCCWANPSSKLAVRGLSKTAFFRTHRFLRKRTPAVKRAKATRMMIYGRRRRVALAKGKPLLNDTVELV